MVKHKNKILLLFPDGVGIRNYLYSDVFKNSEEDLILFHNFDSETETDVKKHAGISQALKIPAYKESYQEKFLRELICLARLKSNLTLTKNETILTNWKSTHDSFSKKIFYKAIEQTASFVKKYQRILYLEKKYQKAIRKNSFYFEIKEILEEMHPNLLFCSHQRGLYCATIFAAAQDLGIQTTTVIYSWDNLPKARMALRADSYLVWSDYMKEEMKLYYPEIQHSTIHVTGTPQFECYDIPKNIILKEDFYNKYNLDLTKKIICYSGDDILTSPDDPQYLEDIAIEILKLGLESEYQILLRRCPIDLSGRFDLIVQKYSHLIKEAPPLWLFKKSTNWSMVYPSREDVSLLVSTSYYSDVVINVGSTMAFDFAMFNKPCIFINYNQEFQNNKNWSVKTIYQFQHFRSMPDTNAVLWLDSRAEVISVLQNALSTKSNPHMKNWQAIVLGNNQAVSKEISKLLKK